MARRPETAPEIEHELRGDVLYLTLRGTFTVENVDPILEEAARLIRVEGAQWNIITDLREAYQGDRKISRRVSEFVKGNRPYTRRSAVILSSGTKRFLFDIAIRVSGRKNMRPFTSVEDAEAWLQSE